MKVKFLCNKIVPPELHVDNQGLSSIFYVDSDNLSNLSILTVFIRFTTSYVCLKKKIVNVSFCITEHELINGNIEHRIMFQH